MSKETKRTVIRIAPITSNLSPLGFHRYASEFLKAAKSTEEYDGFSPVPYYLYCRCLELSFKAFLLAKGQKKADLKNEIRHDLEKAHRRSRAEGLNQIMVLSKIEENALSEANKYYKSKRFEYFEMADAITAYKGLPDLSILNQLCSRLVQHLREPCQDASGVLR